MRPAIPMLILALGLTACVESGEYYAPGPPPPPQAEVVGVAPYPGAVWVGGYHRWYGGRWQWYGGRWERPRAGYYYAPHAYVYRGGRYAYVRGGWRRR